MSVDTNGNAGPAKPASSGLGVVAKAHARAAPYVVFGGLEKSGFEPVGESTAPADEAAP